MAKRYRVLCDYIKYPADKKTFDQIDRAGGLRFMGDRESLNIRRASKGEFCDGMQPRHLKHYLRLGRIEEVASRKKESK